MIPFRYTTLVALNLGMQIALIVVFVDHDPRLARPIPWPAQAAFLCLQLRIGWMFRLQPGPHGEEILGWVIANAFLWAAILEAILCRYWTPPTEPPDVDDDDLRPIVRSVTSVPEMRCNAAWTPKWCPGFV